MLSRFFRNFRKGKDGVYGGFFIIINSFICTSVKFSQGPRSNFEIGGGGGGSWRGAPLVTQHWGGGAQDTFSYQLFIISKILGVT